MRIEILKDRKKVPEIVDIHMTSFKSFFLTFLGRGFLKTMYEAYVEEKKSSLIVAMDDKQKILGFLAYSEDMSGFYKYLIKKKCFIFAGYSFLAFLKKPKILFRLLRAFTYSKEAKRNEHYIELSSIGVLPLCEKKGIGSSMIKYLIQNVDFERYSYIKLETDAENNRIANNFYMKNGFELNNMYITPEGRKMNEYRYYKK